MTQATTIAQVLQQATQQWPQQTAIIDEQTSMSFAELAERAQQCAGAMLQAGLQTGERFAIWAPNIHQWVWTALGGIIAGGVLVPLNTRYRGIEASDILRRSKSRLLFTTCDFLDTDYPALLADHELPDLQEIILLRGNNAELASIDEFCARADQHSQRNALDRAQAISAHDICDIMYTSGTTGAPKGVVSCHGQTVRIFTAWSNTVGLNSNDKYLIVNPFFHSFGYKAGWLSCLIKGATNLPLAVFSPEQTLAMIEQHHITILPGAPTLFNSLLNSPKLPTTDTQSLRCSVTGAASVPQQLVHDMHSTLGFAQVFTAYGLTECPVASITRADDDIALVANTAGKALADTQLRVVDEAGAAVATEQVGRIQVRGYNVMQGYFEDARATQQCLDSDGWLDTGDLGWMDENGYIKVTDRAKDMYICGGFNCYPAEIENLLLRHPNIIDVAVIGVPDPRMGEVGRAYIVSDVAASKNALSHQSLNHQSLNQWAREQMANFKVPRSYVLLPELPRNASGKVQKFLLEQAPTQTIVH